MRTMRLLGLGSEGGDPGGVEDVLVGPELDSSVADVAEERGAPIEGIEDGRASGVGAEPGERDAGEVPPGEQGGRDRVGMGLEVTGAVGVVGDDDGRAVEGAALGFEVEDLADEGAGLLDGRGGESTEGEVGEGVLAVDGGVEGVGGGPDGGGLEEERRDLVPHAGAEVVLVVVGSVPEQEHVAGGRRGPEVEGVGEEVADGLGRGLSEPELVEDVLDGDGGARQALAAAELEEGLGGLEEGPGREDEVVVAVAGVLEPAARSDLDRGPEGSLGGEIATAGLGAEAAAPG